MKPSVLTHLFFGACLTLPALAVDEPEPKPNIKEELKNLVIEDAKRQAAKPAAPAPAATAKPAKPAEPAAPAPAAKDTPKPAEPEPTTVLPKVEVRTHRITELDLQIQQQEKEIARELKNTKSTELDKALNAPEIAHALTIFGGKSNEDRENIAKERVSLMEAERDLMEEIAHAKTKQEKQELQDELDELKAIRRDLEQLGR